MSNHKRHSDGTVKKYNVSSRGSISGVTGIVLLERKTGLQSHRITLRRQAFSCHKTEKNQPAEKSTYKTPIVYVFLFTCIGLAILWALVA